MSTWAPTWPAIKSHESAGRLRRLVPRSVDAPLRKPIFLRHELHQTIFGEQTNAEHTVRYMALCARLEMFIGDEVIASSCMKPLVPYRKGVWEILNKKPNPSLRVFGLFAARDVFIGTHHQLRSALGGFNTPMWKEEIRRVTHEWNQLFEGIDPLVGKLHEVISGATYV
jgi:hypothetical protein